MTLTKECIYRLGSAIFNGICDLSYHEELFGCNEAQHSIICGMGNRPAPTAIESYNYSIEPLSRIYSADAIITHSDMLSKATIILNVLHQRPFSSTLTVDDFRSEWDEYCHSLLELYPRDYSETREHIETGYDLIPESDEVHSKTRGCLLGCFVSKSRHSAICPKRHGDSPSTSLSLTILSQRKCLYDIVSAEVMLSSPELKAEGYRITNYFNGNDTDYIPLDEVFTNRWNSHISWLRSIYPLDEKFIEQTLSWSPCARSPCPADDESNFA